MKRVLIISYYWPPAGGGGVQRVVKFSKYLGRYGWEPLILTVADGQTPQRDPSLEEDVRTIPHIFRVPSREPHAWYRRLAGVFSRGGEASGSLHREPGRLAEWIRLNLFIPDSRVAWRSRAVAAAGKIIADFAPSLIFSTAPPYTAHLIALALKRRYRLPWVADFRDPWVDSFTYNTVPRLGAVLRRNQRMERNVLESADCVLSVGERLGELLRNKLSGSPPDKFRVIHNGYDPADAPERSAPAGGGFILAHYGTLYRQGFPAGIFRALSELIGEETGPGKDLRVRLVGRVDESLGRRFREILPGSRLSLTPYVPHSRMLEQAYAPQVLLLVIPGVPHNELYLTGKLFDYLPTGNPVLGVGPPDGDAAQVLRETGAGEIVAPEDISGFKNAVIRAYRDWQAGRLNRGRREIPAYSRVEQTRQLALLFDHLAESAAVEV